MDRFALLSRFTLHRCLRKLGKLFDVTAVLGRLHLEHLVQVELDEHLLIINYLHEP